MIRALASLFIVATFSAPAHADSFRFPGSDDHRQHYYITAYRDTNGSGGGLQDWNCGTDTYDGHRGTDMGVGGFAGMDAGRDVVAAAPGTVTYVNDGVFDRCTSGTCSGGSGFGNYVRIEHEDGKVTYYAHLKKFSITVATGDTVTCGQKLGQVGSSGYSTGPHLHFEPRVNNVSDDPFAGACSGPTTWWVDQGVYQSLPETTCANVPVAHPLLSMDAGFDAIAGQAEDAYPDGDSAGIFDVEAGQTLSAWFYVTDAADAPASPDVVVGVDIAGDYLELVSWEVFDDHPDNACGGDMCPNDANDNPLNPPRSSPGNQFDLHLNAFAPGETKMVLLTLRPIASTNGESPHAALNMWVKQVEGSYTKTSFDATPSNVDDAQTFNDGDLKQQLLVDTWPGESDPDDPDDPNVANDEAPALRGGCNAASGSTSWPLIALILAVVLTTRRRRGLA